MEKTKELDLRGIFSALVRKWWLIVLCAVFIGAAAYVYTAFFVTPLYKSSVSIYVNNTNTGQNLPGMSSSDLATSQKLVNTYVSILKSDRILDKVAEQIGDNMTADKIRSMLTAEVDEETVLFKVSISHADPEQACKIANAIAEIAPKEIPLIVDGTSAQPVDYAKVATAPYTPNRMKNALLGAAAGALLIVIIVVLQVMMDVHVTSEADLRELSEAPVLGVIPDYGMDYKKDGYQSVSDTEDDLNSKVV